MSKLIGENKDPKSGGEILAHRDLEF